MRLSFATLVLWQFAQAEKLPVRTYTTADGLAHNHINRIKVDSHGFLWFCTDGGLSGFDGHHFFTLTTQDGLPHPDVNDIVETRDGAFWLAGDGGISKFVLASPGASEKPRIVTIRSPEHPDDRYDALELDGKGRLWAGGHAGLYQVEAAGDGGRLKWMGAPVADAPIPRLLADRHEGLWIATGRGAVYRTEDGKYVPVKPSPLGENTFAQVLFQDRAGRMWIGYRTGGLCRLRAAPGVGALENDFCMSEKEGMARDIRSIFEAESGKLWIGATEGLLEFEAGSRKVTRYGPPHGLTENRILRVASDPDGNLWLGTAQNGLMRLSTPGFVQYSLDGYVPGWHPSLSQTRSGRVVAAAGDDAGPARFLEFRGRRFEEFWNALPDANGYPQHTGARDSLEDSQGRMWLSSGRYLYRFPAGKALTDFRSVGPERYILSLGDWHWRLYEDRAGAIWEAIVTEERDRPPVSGRVRVLERSSGEFRLVPEIEASLARIERSVGTAVWVTSFLEDSDHGMWLGISSLRLLYPSNTVTLLRYYKGRVREYSMAEGLPPGGVNGLHFDRRGRLWVATHAGLARLEDPTADRPRFTVYTIAQGLSSDELWCVTEDGEGRIYAGTAKGVDRITPDTGRIRHFTPDEGLPHGRVLAALKDQNGQLWFASDNAVSRFEPEKAAPRAPATYIVQPAGQPVLAHNRNYFEAEFSSPSFTGQPPRFQYRLPGVDDDWRAPVTDGIVRYAGMSPGSYQLEARAVDAEGVVSPQPVSVRFTVLPPFWRTWWFLTLVSGIVAALAYRFHRYRVEQLLAVERLRAGIASDLHDDIGSTLAQVSMLGELAKRSLNGANPSVSDLIERMAGASREAVSSIGDIVWSIHPRHDSVDEMSQRMRRFASDVLSARDIEFDLMVADEAPLAIGLEARRDLLLIFKESIHNAARHSGCRSVKASLLVEGRHLRLSVEDDGRGFDESGARGGHGLSTMRMRAEKSGGRCEVDRGEAGGTRVVVTIPWGEKIR